MDRQLLELQRQTRVLGATASAKALRDLQRQTRVLSATASAKALRDLQRQTRVLNAAANADAVATAWKLVAVVAGTPQAARWITGEAVAMRDDEPVGLEVFPWFQSLSGRARRQLAVQVLFVVAAILEAAEVSRSQDPVAKLATLLIVVLYLLQLSLLVDELRDRDDRD